MGTRMIRNGSGDGRWWLMVGLFTLCVLGWTLAFSIKASAAERADRSWSVSDFDRITISGSPDVELIQGDVERVTAMGDDRALDDLEVYVEDGELVVRQISSGSWWRNRNDHLQVRIELADLEALVLSGASDVVMEELDTTTFQLSVSGSSDIELEQLNAQALRLRISGSADVELAGTVREQQVRITGSGDYKADQLESETAVVRVSGSADAKLRATRSLAARVSGSGSIRYAGAPVVESELSGSGSIRPL